VICPEKGERPTLLDYRLQEKWLTRVWERKSLCSWRHFLISET